ncbi:MAG: ABC transporter permease [Opitutaceae bacterium]|nr:ABC transporter permease [Opitutaceae bacterium]
MSAPGTVSFSLRRIGVIAELTVLEAVRQRLFGVLLVLAAGMIAGAQLLREFNFGSSELKFITDFGFGAVTLFGTILAVVTAAQLFFAEIENRTALTLLAKPVFRAEFVLGKFAGVAAVLALFVGVTTGVLVAVLWMREQSLMASVPEAFERGRLVQYGSVVAFGALQWLKFSVIAALTLVIAGFANTNLYSVVISFLVVLICHLQYLAHESWRRMASGVGRTAAMLLAAVFPNFQMFNVGDRVAAGQAIDPVVLGGSAAYGALYLAVFLALAVYVFRRREI